jgi:histidyl-tRNA synthetase
MKLLGTAPYKGTRDFYPADKRVHNWIFNKIRSVVHGFGYLEYDGPLLEPFEVYAAKTGEEIVNQQLYWLMDRGERKMAIRPEMTPTLARMVAARIHDEPKPIRWFSVPNLWRYERPQRGRLREHWQLNVDVLGGERAFADAELIQLAVEIFRALGGEKFLQIRVNSRQLVNHIFSEKMELSEDVARQLSKLVDAKEKMAADEFLSKVDALGLNEKQKLFLNSYFSLTLENLSTHFPCDASEEILNLFETLKQLGVVESVRFDPIIMRGMDYYTGVVFEAFDVSPENNRALFGGGRYDNLVGLFSKTELSGTGFGLGDVTLQNFLETHQLLPNFESFYDLYCACSDKAAWVALQPFVKEWRNQGLRVLMPLGLAPLKTQFKEAGRLNTPYVLIVGPDELASGQWALKNMKTGEQKTLKPENMLSEIQQAPHCQ